MLLVRPSTPEDIPAQRLLWHLAFGDEGAYVDNFYSTYYRPERVLVLEEGGQVLERVGYTRTTLALVPESQRAALEAEGWVCWDETVSAIPEAGTGASSHANAVIRAIPSRSQQAYITLDAGSESARVLPTLLTRLEARSYAVSVPLETRL